MTERDQSAALHAENTRLIALLDRYGIEWRLPPEPPPPKPAPLVPESELSRFSTAEKVALFRRLFRGRTDVYPIRWESKTTGKSGYYEASGNPLIAQTAQHHWRHLRRVMGGVLQSSGQREAVWDEHEAIADAIRDGDADRAADLIDQHGRSASDALALRLSQVLDNQTAGKP